MKKLILVLLVIGCKAQDQAATGLDNAPPVEPIPPDQGIVAPVTPAPSEPPPQTQLIDHSGRNPMYGSSATEEECQMLADYAIGDEVTFYFGVYWPEYNNMGQAASDYWNAREFFRVDRDGISWRFWDGTRWRGRWQRDVIAVLGPDCTIEIEESNLPPSRVWWQGVQIK